MNIGSGPTSPTAFRFRLAWALTTLGAFARLIPHPPNFTPVGGMALFAGARLRGWQAYLIPLILMAVTDPILSAMYGYPVFGPLTPVIYGSFLLNVWIGRWLKGTENPRRIGAAVLLCSAQFFVLTNAAVWLWGGLYPQNAVGLIACFVAALPFFGRTLAGDLLYAGLLFGLQAWLVRTVSSQDGNLAQGVPATGK